VRLSETNKIITVTFCAEQIQVFVKGAVLSLPFSSLSFHFLLFFPSLSLEVGPLKPARGCGSAVSSSSGVLGGAPVETNLVLSKAVRMPVVAIILNILSTMFYVFEEINWRWCRSSYALAYIVTSNNETGSALAVIQNICIADIR